MSSKLMKMAMAAFLAFFYVSAPAEDIDLFAPNPSVALDRPNVLIVIDNTANWSSAFTAEMAALAATVNALDPDKIRLGFMMFSETGGGNGSPDGGYVRAAVRDMTTSNKALYVNLVNSFHVNSDKSNGNKLALSMSEVNRYFTATTAYAGANKVKRDHTGNTSGTAASNACYALAGNALASSTATNYVSPVTSACQKNYVIYLSNGKSNSNSSDTTTSTSHLSAAGGNTTTIPLTPSGEQGEIADEWSRYLASKTTSPVVTYVIDVVPTNAGQYSTDYKALLQSMATQGKGEYYDVGSAGAADVGIKIQAALNDIITQINSVNSAFASASLPVSVNVQGRYLNQVFIGQFRAESTPRWYGNLKQYQFRADLDNAGAVVGLTLVDKINEPVRNPLSEFIKPCAQSFWSTADTYWPLGYQGNCSSVTSNSPDGEIVEKGGAAQRLRSISGATGASARSVKTCSVCGDASTLVDFGTSTASIASLGVADATAQSALVAWARGQNVDGELSKLTTEMRPSVHGDVVHSRPLAIDYGVSTGGVVVFYGGNDGMLRAIDGDKLDSAGNELWSFAAPEHYGKLKRLKSNSPLISFPGITATPTPTPKDYFFDGPIGVYRSGSSTWIYPTMRRGGSVVYAFDVSTPTIPTLKWKRDSALLANMGQTWSEPKVITVANVPTTPLIIMGGGYDSCEDQDAAPYTACTSPTGNRVFVLNANTGALLKTLTTDRSVPADITAVDSDGDGYVDMAYAVDTAANVYRINIGTNAPASWTINKIAALGCTSSASCARKFLHAPEVVVDIGFNAVLVGSGNRERPLLANAATNVDNAFFMIKDDLSVSPTVITTSELVSIDPDVVLTTAQQNTLATSENKGWHLAFGTGDHDKEQVVTSAVVVAGVTYFSTHMPTAPTACGVNLGTARSYAVNYLNASAEGSAPRFTESAGGGLPPSPVAGVVSVPTTTNGVTTTHNVPFVLTTPVKVVTPIINVSGVRGRVYWYIEQ